jgi:hypothetical protein
MARVTTNSISLAYTREASLGVLPGGSPVWKQAEPNNINRFGAQISRVARTPIQKARQRRKGVVTDLNSGVEFEADATYEQLRDVLDAFFYAKYVGPPTYIPSAVTSSGYTVPAVTNTKFTYGASAAKTLVYARGFVIAANNGLKVITGAVANAATTIAVTGLTAETVAATKSAMVSIAGVRGATADLQIDAQGNLISTALDFTTLGLYVGQFIWVGGAAVGNQFANAANTGFARIRVIAANKLTLEKKGQAFVTDAGTGKDIDILFGEFCRNVDVGDADYQETSTQFQLTSPNLGTGGATNYEQALGNYADAITLNINLTDKATASFGFVGTDTQSPSATPATNSGNAQSQTATAALSSATDLARLRIQDVDESGLTTDFKSMTLTLTNNVSPEKVLGKLGAAYMNVGNFEVDIQSTLLFSNGAVVARIRGNTTVGLDFCIKNGDGGVYFDIPSGELDGGDRAFPVNQSVTLNSTLQARKDDALGYSLSASFFPYLPA